MSEKNEAVVRRMFEEVLNSKKLDAIEKFHTNDYANHDPLHPTTGLDAYTKFVKKWSLSTKLASTPYTRL